MLGWLCLPLRKKDFKLWRVVPLCLIWAIWKERNKVVFKDKAFSRTKLKSCFLVSFSSWAILVHYVEHFFVRDIFVFPSFVLVGWFVFCSCAFFPLVWLLAPLCIRLVYSLGTLVPSFMIYITLIIHKKKISLLIQHY